MNRKEREALVEKVRRSENPFEALFGTGPRPKRRQLTGGSHLPPRETLPSIRDREKLHLRTVSRVLQIMKHLDPDLYSDLYQAEIRIAVAKLDQTDLKTKYKRNLVPGSRAE